MYTPSHSKSKNLAAAFELMDRHPFATLISVVDGKSQVSHLPLTPVVTKPLNSDSNPSEIYLIGHFARANPHWKSIATSPLTITFMGGHTYISPTWYEENDVPTWNYSAVHIEGRAELIEDYEGLLACLKTLSAHAEQQWPSGWKFFVPDDLADPKVLTKSIVGFRIHIDTLDFKQKLSRNRSLADQIGVIKGLSNRTDSASLEVRDDMETGLRTPAEGRP